MTTMQTMAFDVDFDADFDADFDGFDSSGVAELVTCQVLPQLLRERVIDRAIADSPCSPDETAQAVQQWYQAAGLTTPAEQQAWCDAYHLSQSQLEFMATRRIRLQRFKERQWGNKLESYYLTRKKQLDRVVYSMIRSHDANLIQELFFRIQAGEQSFADLAHTYSEGPEATSYGIVGPIEFETLHPHLAQLLSSQTPGEVAAPVRMNGWFILVRVESILPTPLNEFVRSRLLNELFDTWLDSQLQQLPEHDRRWFRRRSQPNAEPTPLTKAA